MTCGRATSRTRWRVLRLAIALLAAFAVLAAIDGVVTLTVLGMWITFASSLREPDIDLPGEYMLVFTEDFGWSIVRGSGVDGEASGLVVRLSAGQVTAPASLAVAAERWVIGSVKASGGMAYFLLDTQTKNHELDLSEDQLGRRMRELGLAEPPVLKPVEDWR